MKKRRPRSTKLNPEQHQTLEHLIVKLGDVGEVASYLGTSETSVSRWRRWNGVDHSIIENVRQALALAAIQGIEGVNFPNRKEPSKTRLRARRSTNLSPDGQKALKELIQEKGSIEAAALYLGVTTKTIGRWSKQGGVDHSIARKVWNALGLSVGLQVPDPIASNPIEEINNLFETGRKLHFDEYRPAEASEKFARIIFHPRLDAIPISTLLDIFSVIMSIYRQSSFVTDQTFLDCADVSLKRLSAIRLHDEDHHLPANICAVAWELIAITVQRGHARIALPFLYEINRLLDDFRLWEYFVPGRERQIRRMFHWAQIVAIEDIAEARQYLLKFDNPMSKDLGKLVVHKGAERINTDAQKLAELLRFSSNPGRFRERDLAIKLFYEKVFPTFKELSANASLLNPHPGIHRPESLARIITPATALGIAFQATVVAVSHDVSNAQEIIERTSVITRQIRQLSHGAVFLHYGNPEMLRALRQIKAYRPDSAANALYFPIARPVAAGPLHQRARDLLGFVEKYFSTKGRSVIP